MGGGGFWVDLGATQNLLIPPKLWQFRPGGQGCPLSQGKKHALLLFPISRHFEGIFVPFVSVPSGHFPDCVQLTEQ